MLKRFWDFLDWLVEDDDPPTLRPDLRRGERYRFNGVRLPVGIGPPSGTLRLMNLSCGGASGLIDEPFRVGQTINVRLEKYRSVEALVCWVRRSRTGIAFVEPLDPDYVATFYEDYF